MHEQRAFQTWNMDASISSVGEAARLAAMYHVVEKGLTMPGRRLGFGQAAVSNLARRVIGFRKMYGENCSEYKHAVAVLAEYYKLHEQEQVELLRSTKEALEECLNGVVPSAQPRMTPEAYWGANKSDFAAFSTSRHSVRHYGKGSVPLEDIEAAVALANNAPSACNRQPCKVYCVQESGKMAKLLQIQGGNRGFGHLADKVLVLTCNRRAFMPNEPLSVYVNGGIYLMNLAYSLHYYKIAHCILTWVPTPENDILAHELLGIDMAEAVIALLTCGVLPADFMHALSPKKKVNETFSLL